MSTSYFARRWGGSPNLALGLGRFLLALIAPVVLFVGLALAAPEELPMPESLDVEVTAALKHAKLPPGGETILAVTYQLPDASHLQPGDFLYVNPAEGQSFTLGLPLSPNPTSFEGDPVYQGTTTFYYRLRLSPTAPTGAGAIKLLVGYQGCIEQPVFACFSPEEISVELPIEVGAGAEENGSASALFAAMSSLPPAIEGAGAPIGTEVGSQGQAADAPVVTQPKSLEQRLEEQLEKRSFLAFLLVFLGGVATSFTPCVYPIIPITISYIGGRSKGKLGGFILSLFFVLGIAIMYSTLGVVAASSGALFGNAMQSTGVLIFVSAIFFAMGASMLGAFDIALPAGLQTKLQEGPRTGVIGAIFMGMVTGLVASPCVGPVLVVLLAWVAKVGAIGLGFALLFTFAVGLGLLFLVIGTFAGALNALPKAGQWMDTVKHVFGVILFAMGIFYLRSLIGPGWTWFLSGVLAVMVGTFLGAFRTVNEDAEHGVLMRKGFGWVLLVAGSFALIIGLARISGVALAPGQATGPSTQAVAPHHGLAWVHDDLEGMAAARSAGMPVVMDFYADWCAACVELDEKSWVDPAVKAEAERFVAIKMDFTARNEANAKKQASYGVMGLPTVIFFDSAGNEVERFFGFRPPDQILASMKRIS
ncbi:MAG: thioredoxin family protein [Candidatus Eisenbacteria bacterium]|nr:thioredoxin family protein [Candidatus Eisenbacteria bacterium]